jgi:hypothetical protein
MAAANCRSLSPTLTVAYQADLGCLSSGHTRLVTIFRSGGVSFTETCSWADVSSRLMQFSLVLTRSGLSLGLGEPDSDSERRPRKFLSGSTSGSDVPAALLYAVEGADFLYLLNETCMSKGNLSSHLSKLEEAAYVEIAKTYRGKIPHTVVKLTPKGRSAFDEYRARLKTISAGLGVADVPRPQ